MAGGWHWRGSGVWQWRGWGCGSGVAATHGLVTFSMAKWRQEIMVEQPPNIYIYISMYVMGKPVFYLHRAGEPLDNVLGRICAP